MKSLRKADEAIVEYCITKAEISKSSFKNKCHSAILVYFPYFLSFQKTSSRIPGNSLWLSHVTLFKGESWPPNKCFVDHLWGPDDGDGTWKIEVQRRFCWWNLQKFNLVVVFNISFDVHPYLGMIFDLTKNLSDGLKPPTMIV